MCTICIEGPPRQFDALLARLHQQSMLIFATIALGHPKWTLSTTAGVFAMRFFEWFFFAGILEPSLDCLKAVYLAINDWFSGIYKELNYFRCWAKAFIAALLYSVLDFNIVTILRIWLFINRSIRLSLTPTTTSGGSRKYSGKF